MTEILISGCGMKVLQREWDLLILTGRMRDSFNIGGGMRDEIQTLAHHGRYAENS